MSVSPQERAKELVREYLEERLEKTDPEVAFDVFVVWFGYVLGNWKCLLSTTLPDRMYYEVTGNASKSEIYLDAYQKVQNLCFTDEVWR